MNLVSFLVSIGINVVSSAVYDKLRSFFSKKPNPTSEELTKEMQKHLANGNLIISGSHVFAKDSICLESSMGTEFQIKDGSSTRTDQTSMEVGLGAFISGSGGAAIHQSKDGITFSV
jgi:hypothetical protein